MFYFSMIIPSRGRQIHLNRILRSIQRRTRDLNTVETFVILDEDDVSNTNIQQIQNLKILKRTQGHNLSDDYFNWTFKQTSGKFIVILNDDVQINLPNWDIYVWDRLNNAFNDNIVYGRTYTQGVEHPYSEFPIIGRTGCELLGWLYSKHLPGWGADHHLWKIYHAIGRDIDLAEMVFGHMTGNAINDEAARHMADMTKSNESNAWEINTYIDQLNKGIQEMSFMIF